LELSCYGYACFRRTKVILLSATSDRIETNLIVKFEQLIDRFTADSIAVGRVASNTIDHE
jgi:hypothetical protein